MLKFDEAKALIESLACSQGMYKQLYEALEEQLWLPLKEWIEIYKFTDSIDFIMWLEN